MQTLRIGNLNLTIDSPAEWICQFGARPKPVLANGLLKHQFSPITLQISEALLRTGIQHAKSKQLCVEAKASAKFEQINSGTSLARMTDRTIADAYRQTEGRARAPFPAAHEIGNILHRQHGPLRSACNSAK